MNRISPDFFVARPATRSSCASPAIDGRRVIACPMPRKLQPERGAHADLALHMDLAGVFLHDAVAHRQAQPGALVLPSLRLGLGGKERVEDAMQVIAFDACAEVLHHAPSTLSASLLRRNPSSRAIWRAMHRVACAFSSRFSTTCCSLPSLPWIVGSIGSRSVSTRICAVFNWCSSSVSVSMQQPGSGRLR